MNISPHNTPVTPENRKPGIFLPQTINSIIRKAIYGKNSSLRCSQMLSFIGTNGAMTDESPLSLYIKWFIHPMIDTIRKPTRSEKHFFRPLFSIAAPPDSSQAVIL